MTLGKLLPSFGLIGTLIGMVLLLSRMSALEPKGLPAALGLAVLTTLYGAVIANVLVAPLLARVQSAAVEQESSMNLTKDWILMIARGETAMLCENMRPSLLDLEPDRGQVWNSIGAATQR
jgi:chemotaxis protein MotA